MDIIPGDVLCHINWTVHMYSYNKSLDIHTCTCNAPPDYIVTHITWVSNLSFPKSFPNFICRGMRSSRAAYPARQKAPSMYHNTASNTIAIVGPTHKKWTKSTTWNKDKKLTRCVLGNVKRILNPYSAGIDFSRQNLTSVDVRFWRLKSIPALQE